MSKFQVHNCLNLAVLFTLAFLIGASPVLAASESYTLANGMQVILKENHNSPMVASVIFIKSGSKYESKFENGLTHFLEHLLFDGTANQSRVDLDLSIRDLGGYINAFTRKETTAYLVLVPKQFINYGMTVQADMLFNSIFPEVEMTKERQVVIEEMKQGKDRPGYAADAFFTEQSLAGTNYANPVLGYESFINNIPREAVINYWKKYYRPENMITLIIGDFDSKEMKKEIEAVFGRYPIIDGNEDKTAPAAIEIETTEAEQSAKVGLLTGQTILDTVAAVNSTYIDFSFNAPRFDDPDYPALDLLVQYLSLDDLSPLMTALKSGADPLASTVSISLVPYEEFSRLNISIVTNKTDQRQAIADSVLTILGRAVTMTPEADALEGIKISSKCNDIYMADKLHYYGFIIAPMIMTAGYDFIEAYPDMIEKTEWTDCQAAATKWLSQPDYLATMVRPADETSGEPYLPPNLTETEVNAHFATAKFADHELIEGHTLEMPATDEINFDINDPAIYSREVLDNGLTVLLRQSSDSRVFAVNILGKNRSAMEADSKAGITDFVNRCLERGTPTRDASQLATALNKIGANLTLTDNPWIPYDDRYTTNQFSFVKFETIDEFAPIGMELLTDMLINPAFDSVEVEQVRATMSGVIGRQSGSVRTLARNLFKATLFDDGPYAKPIMGDFGSVGSITVSDLKEHHNRFYSPNNMILAISSRRPAAEVMGWLNAGLGQMPAVEFSPIEILAPEPKAVSPHVEVDKEQIQIQIGAPFTLANQADAASVKVASLILSSRLYLNLREKQGLAYSIGAGVTLDRNFGWYTCGIGTGAENYQTAIDGIKLQMDKLRLDGPRQAEIDRSRNQIWGKLMSAKLSRINQAYYMCLNEFYGHPLDWDQEYLKQLSLTTPASIRAAYSKYFSTDFVVTASAGKRLEK